MNIAQIINHSHLDPSWHWLEESIASPQLEWSHHSDLQYPGLLRLPVAGVYLSRLLAANRAVSEAAGKPHPLLVSHGPRPAYYAARLAQLRRHNDIPHLVYSFNFTKLPGAAMSREMRKAYRSIDRFAVFSTMERQLYAEHFDLDPARIDMLHWAIDPGDPAALPAPKIAGRYICAVGSQGRDYRVLLEAARLLPHIPLHIVVHPENLQGLDVPPHVKVHASIPYAVAAGIVAHAEFMVLPLLHSQVPCGHVTAVMAMHLGRAIIATDSVGLHDYLKRDETALLVEASNPQTLAKNITRLWENKDAADRLGAHAQTFARQHCVEANVMHYFRQYLRQRLGLTWRDEAAVMASATMTV